MLPGFELNRIPKKDIFDSKKFLVIFTVILCSTALTSFLFCVRYVSEQTCKLTCFSYVVFLFFPVKWHYLVLQDTFFRHFEVFTKKNIVMPGGTISHYIDKKEKTLFTCEPNFTARRPFLAVKRRIKTYSFPFDYHGDHCGDAWRVCKTSLHCTFYFDLLRSLYMHTTFRT